MGGELSMSAIAGRVMPLPRGAYNSATEYHILDIVSYGNAAYMALQTTQGNAPTNTTYWQKLVDSATQLAQLSDVDFNNVLNGQVPMYDSTSNTWKNATIDLSGKADKVSGATNGNFAGLDANGNLTDSGHKHSDYLTSHQDISGKADKVTSATNGNFAALNASGNLTDSGKKASDFTYTNGTGISKSGNTFSADFGTTSGKVCQGNDSRLSDARTPTAHNQAASTITAGTLAGRVQANATAAGTLTNAQVRDIYAGTSDMTAGTSSLTTGSIYLVYEA